MRTCPDCQYPNDPNAIFCENCGFKLQQDSQPENKAQDHKIVRNHQPASTGTCSACGYLNTPGETFCQNCGVQLSPVPSTPPPPPIPFEEVVQSQASEVTKGETQITCEECSAINNSTESYCLNCGLDLRTTDQGIQTAEVQLQPSGRAKSMVDAATSSAPIVVDIEKPCPSCEYENVPGEAFCQNCGYPLASSSDQSSAPGDIVPTSETGTLSTPSEPDQENAHHVSGRFIVEQTGRELPYPPGNSQLVIGRADPEEGIFPDIDLTAFGGEQGGVSRQHARLSKIGDHLLIEDLNSTNLTFLNRLRLHPGEQHLVIDGDKIRLGGVVLIYKE